MRIFVVAFLVLVSSLHAAPAADAPKEDRRHPAAAEWPVNGGDWGNTRYSALDQINTATVKDLAGAWVKKLDNASSRAILVVHDGLMFMTTGSDVIAVNPKTGETVWTYTPEIRFFNTYKGVAVGDGLVFIGLVDSRIVALKEKTGERVWDTLVGDPVKPRDYLVQNFTYPGAPLTGQFISAAPTYANGMVIVPMAAGDYGIRGRIAAFDAKTGKRVWKFDTVPGPGEFGHDTWQSDNDLWKTGGAGVWMTPTVDPDLGLVYVGTGNAVPYYAGENRGGDNLFSVTVLALDIKTGKRRWYRQLTHHDMWEGDLATPIMLYDTKIGGKLHKAIAVMRVDGYMFLMDRASGEPIIPIEERPVRQSAAQKSAATQPFPVGADSLAPDCVGDDMGVPAGFERSCNYDPVDYSRPNVIVPGYAIRLSPMSYSPQTGYFYAFGGVSATWHRRFKDQWMLSTGGSVAGLKSWGTFTAIDGRTDKIVWQKRMPRSLAFSGGATATAGGLVFHGEPDGNLQAYDAKTGDLVWQFQTGYAADEPVISYAVDGKQYVAFVATDATIWSFALGGPIKPPPPPAEPAPIALFAGIAHPVTGGSMFTGRVYTTNAVDIGVVVKDQGLMGPRQELDEYQFGPKRTKVKAGTTVTWANKGGIPHDATSADGAWTTGEIAPGASGSVTFSKPGTYTYIDKGHPFMYGEITVE